MELVLISWVVIFFSAAKVFLRSRFDVISISFIGSFLYAFPILFIYEEYEIWVYASYWIVFISLSFFSIAVVNKEQAILKYKDIYYLSKFMQYSLFLIILILFYFIKTYGILDFFAVKQEQQRSGGLSVIFSSLIALGFLSALVCRIRKYQLIYGILLAFLFITGSRTQIVICLLSSLLVFFKGQRFSIFNFIKPRYLFALFALVIIGIWGKVIYASVSFYFNNESSLYDSFQLVSSVNNSSLNNTEPFYIIKMYSDIVKYGISIEPDYLWDLPYHLTPFASLFTDTLHHFSEFIKSILFSSWGKKAGVGGTFFGEGYALSGLLGSFFYVVIFLYSVLILNYLYYIIPYYLLPLLSILAVNLGFYVHRNALFQLISHQKKYIMLFMFIMSILFIFDYIKKRIIN